MFSSIITLEYFIRSVPICTSSTDLNTVLATLHSGTQETIVIVNDRGQPLGMIGCSQLLKYLLEQLRVKSVVDSTILQEGLHALETLMTPLLSLPAQISISQLGTTLINQGWEAANFPPYALVDYQGKFLGLLDRQKLLRYLFSQQSSSFNLQQKHNLSQLQQFLLAFIEQLPLPVNLLTEQGEVLYQNQLWCQQVGASVYPALTQSPVTSQALVSMACRLSLVNAPNYSQAESLSDNNSLAVKILTRSLSAVTDVPLIHPPPMPPSFSDWQDEQIAANYAWELIKVPLDFSAFALDIVPDSLWLVIAIDQREKQKSYQELMTKNTDLLQLNRLKDEFFTCISHELKSPLTSVIGLSSLLKEQKVGELSERQINYAQLIYQSGRFMMTLVNDMLDLTRLQTGELKLNITSVEITSICQQAYQLLKDKYQNKTEKKISFTLEIETRLTVIKADEIRLRQMLFYLLDNALNLAEVNGKIGLKVNQWNHWLAFTIWDTGTAIPEKFQPLIFEQYQSQENSWTGQLENTGLGLVLTQQLAKAHGGDISFISRQEQGNQFTLLLPLDCVNNLPPRNTFYAHSKPLILVVESLPSAIENLTDILGNLGYPVVVARTGTEALEKTRQLTPEIIFLNPLLPLLSGWDLLKLLKSDPNTQNIPVIITSYLAEQQDKKNNGGDGFLSFPVEKTALQTILNSIFPKLATDAQRKTNRSKLDEIDFSSVRNLTTESLSVIEEQLPLTILRLHSTSEYISRSNSPLESLLKAKLPQLNYRLLEADNLEQAEMIATVWDIDVVVLDDYQLSHPLDYIQSLCQCKNLAALPLVTLDATTTKIANKTGQLSVFPCLNSSEYPPIESLLKVIAIAAKTK